TFAVPDAAATQEPGPSVEIAEPELRFEVCVVDEFGDAVADVELECSHGQGPETGTVTTGADGIARFERHGGPGLATLRFGDLDGLREALRTRWDQPDRRPGTQVLEPGKQLSVALLANTLDGRGFSIAASHPHTISIQPKIVLARLFGPSFEPSKSLVLPAALARLAAVRRMIADHSHGCVLISSAGSKESPCWRSRAAVVHDF